MFSVKFKYQDETKVHPKLIVAINKLCEDKGKDCLCTSGYRSLAKQKIINADSLRSHKGAYQLSNGAVYTPDGKCWAAAYGASNHCYCIAMDITDDWFKAMTNSSLYRYGLYKPMSYEPWHIQLLEHSKLTQAQKEEIRDSVLKGADEDMTVTEFQSAMGLNPDGIAGPMTQAKAKEVLKVCQDIIGNKFERAEEVIIATQNSPSMWIDLLKKIKFFDSFVMNIYKKMRGE